MEIEDNIEIKNSMAFKYLASIFKNSEKCKQEVFNGIKQARKAKRIFSSLHWSKDVSLNTKKQIF